MKIVPVLKVENSESVKYGDAVKNDDADEVKKLLFEEKIVKKR